MNESFFPPKTALESKALKENISPRQAPPMSDKSLDIHLILSALDSATRRAPNKVEYPEWRASLSAEHRRNLVAPFLGNPFL